MECFSNNRDRAGRKGNRMKLFHIFKRIKHQEETQYEDEMTVMEELGITEQEYYCFDGECVEEDDCYADILRVLSRISKGGFEISNVTSQVNHEEEKVSLSFDYNGKTFEWKPVYEYDWFDCNVFTDINKLLEENGSEKYFYGYSPDQTVHVVFVTEKVGEELKDRTGNEFERL